MTPVIVLGWTEHRYGKVVPLVPGPKTCENDGMIGPPVACSVPDANAPVSLVTVCAAPSPWSTTHVTSSPARIDRDAALTLKPQLTRYRRAGGGVQNSGQCAGHPEACATANAGAAGVVSRDGHGTTPSPYVSAHVGSESATP